MQEHVVESYLGKMAKKNGFLCYKFTSPGRDGVPDRILMGHEMTFFVETKAPGKTLRKLQAQVIKEMKAHGAIVYTANTKEQVDLIFKEIEEILTTKQKGMITECVHAESDRYSREFCLQ